MTVHHLRDCASTTSGYYSGTVYTPFIYYLAIFLNRVLGYSQVGQTGFNLNNNNVQTFTYAANTAIAAASSGQVLPQSTINVVSTSGFPPSGTAYVASSATTSSNPNGIQIIKYSGTTATSLLNCTGGTGTMNAGQNTTIASGSNNISLPTGTINVISTAGFASSGTIYVITTAGPQIVTYTGTNAGTQFTGCTGGTGVMNTGNSVASANGVVACGLNTVLTATGGFPTITTTFPHGMSNGDYATFGGGGSINTSIVPAYPVTVIDTFTLIIQGIVSSGTYTPNSQWLQPAGLLVASGTVAGGAGASINFSGAPSVYAVQIPTANRTVVNGSAPTTGDVGRLLVLRSPLYPTKNSGVFKITAVNTATNSYTIDYRSSDTPPPETGTMDWWIYEIETQASNYMQLPDFNRSSYSVTAASNTTPIQITFNVNTLSGFRTGQKVNISSVTGNTAANGTWVITINPSNPSVVTLNGSSGNGTYTGGGSITRVGYTGGESLSYNSKVLLQSPHVTGWQTRIAVEQYNIPGVTPYTSVSVGYNGTVAGDWVQGGTTTHTGAFLGINPAGGTPYQYTYTGSADNNFAPRVTIVGDDGGQSVFVYTKAQISGANGLMLMGIPDNEPVPTAPNTNRPFIYGSNSGAGPTYGGIQMRSGNGFNVGFTFRDIFPEMCMIAGWANLDGVSFTSPVYSANAGDCPFTGTTEVLPWEIWGGVLNDPQLGLPYGVNGPPIYYILNQRFMGTAPYLRQGRTNFGNFTLSTESTATSTITTATQANPIQITTSAVNALVTGQTVVITGVLGNTAANGTWVITVIDNTHFTLNNSKGNNAYAGGGTVQGTAHWQHLQNGIYLLWNGAGGLTP
jgi:hypothetical protein